jgi:TRAP-type C4-dicarboxylate transport system permease small subunit
MRFALHALSALNNALERAITVYSALLVAGMVLILFGGAITRYVTGIGFNTFLELPPMLMPWLVFPLTGMLMRGSSHISVDYLPEQLGPRGRRILRIAVLGIATAAGVVFCYAGFQATSLFRMVGQMTEMEWEFPIWWIYLSFPVGFAILTLFSFEGLLRAALGEDPEPRPAAPLDRDA